MSTRISDIGSAPVQVNPAGHGLGEPGQSVRLTNAGDNPVSWWIAATQPDGVPGFPIARGASHEITLPELPLWAWTRGTSRLLVTPLGGGGTGIVPGASVAAVLGQTPVAISPPAGAREGTRMLAVAAGDPVHAVLGSAGAAPDPLVPETTLGLGQSMPLIGGADGGANAWWWTDRHAGAVVLLTVADDSWVIA